jgi:hypothetical protein
MTRVAGWAAAAALSVYVGLKVLWVLGIDVGVVSRGTVSERAWVLENAVTALIGVVGVLVALVTVRPWGMRVPLWLVAIPMWAGAGLLAPFVVVIPLALLLLAFGWWTPPPAASDGSGLELATWVFGAVYGSFALGGTALLVALAGYARHRLAGLRLVTGPPRLPDAGDPAGRPELPLAWLALALGLVAVAGRVSSGGDALQRLVGAVDAAQTLAAVLGLLALLYVGGRAALVATWLGAGGLLAKGFLGMPAALSGQEPVWDAWTTFLTCVVGGLVSLVTLFSVRGAPSVAVVSTPAREGRPGRGAAW